MTACITLWQPYASLIFSGHKVFETRGFRYPSKLGGQRLAIHAAKRPLAQCGVSTGLDQLCREVFGPDYAATLPRGALLGSGLLAGCFSTDDLRPFINREDDLTGDFRPGRFAWLLEDIQALAEPRPMNGKQGWSTVDL
jgi:hypothetical protein